MQVFIFFFQSTALVTTFNVEIGITGAILTKLDGDSRGGSALSVKEVHLAIAFDLLHLELCHRILFLAMTIRI